MGDLSAEPSMEDILASIKRVIKEGEAQTPVRRQQPRPLGGHERDHVLELNEPLGTAQPEPAPTGQSPSPLMTAPWEEDAGFNEVSPLASAPVPTPTPAPTPAPAVAPASAPAPASASPSEPAAAVSPATVEATRGALGALSRLVVKPEPDGDGTLEGLVRDMLRPMLSDWLDQNLPRLVEQMVAREIAKITSQQN